MRQVAPPLSVAPGGVDRAFGLSRRMLLLGGAGTVALAGRGAQANDIVDMRMLNEGADGEMVFDPDLVRIPIGGGIRFLPTDRGHFAASIRTILPESARPFATNLDAEEVVRFAVPGVYGIQCPPHYTMGMVAVVVVGQAVNLEAAKAVRMSGPQGSRMRKILARMS